MDLREASHRGLVNHKICSGRFLHYRFSAFKNTQKQHTFAKDVIECGEETIIKQDFVIGKNMLAFLTRFYLIIQC